ncbi:PGPGW domain-containing protein [Microvirga sp. ACRRW]|uniref:PGPGW domain-containing protein n=1 Tax=Microvirga sp. ACRRW TaxID=2918205 RepID=UPI001EF6625A|nr:PGPGW domain-containing protein [Microvirga sp. ACRRW]MCG7394892.1 PGPGW domain-containing protein [Microvirga sp. ACRRW]
MTKPRVAFGGRHVPLPRSRIRRICLGIALILGGVVGFLPVLGFWMVPLGILILSFDLHMARRLRRRTIVWWERRKRAKRGNR